MSLINSSASFYNIAILLYVIALILSIVAYVKKNQAIPKLTNTTAALGFIAQTLGMVVRWHEAGLVEVSAKELALGVKLEGLSYFVVYAQHPPWSNLYEILVFMSWGLILVYLVADLKFTLKFAALPVLLLVLTCMGMASLVDDGTIKPLVPALQSWWIMIHVISSAIAYSAGTLGAVLSLLYLLKATNEIKPHIFGAIITAFNGFLMFIIGRGVSLFKTGAYKSKVMSSVDGVFYPAGASTNGQFQAWFEPMPFVGYLLIALVALGFAAFIILLFKKSFDGVRILNIINPLALLLTLSTLFLILYYDLMNVSANISSENSALLTAGAPGPWSFHLKANSWDIGLILIMISIQSIHLFSQYNKNFVNNFLPEKDKLDQSAYYSIIVSFALVAVVLVTGALWAHYAWGRYWGWDPKETGALVIWLVYAVYIHARTTHGLVGVPSALIGLLGFFVILAGFLGVNLGFFSHGLHDYGSS